MKNTDSYKKSGMDVAKVDRLVKEIKLSKDSTTKDGYAGVFKLK